MIVFVYDFDDTLFATSYFSMNPEGKSALLSDSISSLLNTSLKYGKVYIITNASRDWPEFVINSHLIDGKNILDNITIVSTHNCYKTDMSTWKTLAFNETLKKYFEDGNKHELISFGDSPYDYAAALSIKERYPNVIVKSVRMGIMPSLTQLLCQQTILYNQLEFIVQNENHLDLVMHKS